MEYTIDLFIDFLKSIETYSSDCEEIERSFDEKVSQIDREYDLAVSSEKKAIEATITRLTENRENAFEIYSATLSDLENGEKNRRVSVINQIIRYEEYLYEANSRVEQMLCYELYKGYAKSSVPANISEDSLQSVRNDIISMINNLESNTKNIKRFEPIASEMSGYIKGLNIYLNNQINKLFTDLYSNQDYVDNNRKNAYNDYNSNLSKIDDNMKDKLLNFFESVSDVKKDAEIKRRKNIDRETLEKESQLQKTTNEFFQRFSPSQMENEFFRIYDNEPSVDNYVCVKHNPSNVRISDLSYPLDNLQLTDYAKKVLNKSYFFLTKYANDGNRHEILKMPYCVTFDKNFNYVFELNSSNRDMMVDRACSIAMRLFMMLPPNKVNFTFFDPITLGETFASFTRLVEVDDRTSKVINGKIWTSSKDIEDKLHVTTDHIANVTQRCLQGRYDNIQQYNEDADQNAEPYQVLMVMDFPAGFNEESLRLLEQIISTGPKCGVYTILMKSDEQYAKIDEKRIKPLVDNIVCNVCKFVSKNNGLTFEDVSYHNKKISFDIPAALSNDELNKVIPVLKEGIRTADRVIIDYNKMVSNANISHSTDKGIRIPIGIHGANEVQYMTLGVGGSHHALIAGATGSGKSTLMHTIIFGLLNQYSPEELSIYLVDFKRGVEFKIYADYCLPAFKVVAIESEREFGYNVLAALEREQKIRADLFKRNNVYNIGEYRKQNKKMPRILVIMDEFQELFPESGDELSKKSSEILERIVRQGRAFGIHLMLATQSYSNVKGIDRAVFSQMAVRIVLKCSKSDANLLLDDGASVIDQISIDDPGRAIYNSEAGNMEYNSHFRVAYIPPKQYGEMLQKISDDTIKYLDPEHPTRILLTNIENNNFSVFERFDKYSAESYKNSGKLYIGESLTIDDDMSMKMSRTEYSNILMVGGDTDMARSMFTFAMLSLCINYWIIHRKAPDKPIITLLNAKPLIDSYFKDTAKLISDFLPEYVRYVNIGNINEIQQTVSGYYDQVNAKANDNYDQYFFVFGYQRAEELKSEVKLSQSDEIDNIFNITQNNSQKPKGSVKDMFFSLVKEGSQKGIHTIIWQDSFNALYQDDKDIISYFSMRIAFDMSSEEYSRFVGYNDSKMLGNNNAIFFSRSRDNQKFRPYQAPDEEWLKKICNKLK
ncbi:MAG: FtsK/SpoIIIE domain-containing protein [Acutalibacteraceae bacterium]